LGSCLRIADRFNHSPDSSQMLLPDVRSARTSGERVRPMSRRLFMITVLLLAFPSEILFAEELVARNPRVLFITEKNCQRCTEELLRLNKPRGEFETMRSIGWKIGETAENHIQIVDRESI